MRNSRGRSATCHRLGYPIDKLVPHVPGMPFDVLVLHRGDLPGRGGDPEELHLQKRVGRDILLATCTLPRHGVVVMHHVASGLRRVRGTLKNPRGGPTDRSCLGLAAVNSSISPHHSDSRS